MWELAVHYEQMRRAYPDDHLCVVFDIDGTILDMRHLVAHVLCAYDREHDTDYFRGLSASAVTVHENRIDDFLTTRVLPADERRKVLAWYAQHLWTREAVLAASQPFRGVLGVIRWFQIQPATSVALNTGRPEGLRDLTLMSLNAIGRAYRVGFSSELLYMNPRGWNEGVADAKVDALRRLQERGLRVVAVVDNQPANIRAMAEADSTAEILFLHADTIFESQRELTPRTVRGSKYALAGLIPERELRRRVEFVWHGVNDEANLRQFLASGVRWAECDVRRDPLDRVVLRHDSFEDTPWTRAEHPFLLQSCLAALRDSRRGVVLDVKEGGRVLERALETTRATGFEERAVRFTGSIDVLQEDGIRRVATELPHADISIPVDFLAPLLLAVPDLAGKVLKTLSAWGVKSVSLAWTTPAIRELVDALELEGWQVNVYGVPDLEAFFEAALLLPRSVTADFNFPDWHYYGRGSGQRHSYHRYGLISEAEPTNIRLSLSG